MTAFTVLGVLWFWMLCFEFGYWLIPGFHAIRAGWAIWLFGREAERVVAIFAAEVGAGMARNDQEADIR